MNIINIKLDLTKAKESFLKTLSEDHEIEYVIGADTSSLTSKEIRSILVWSGFYSYLTSQVVDEKLQTEISIFCQKSLDKGFSNYDFDDVAYSVLKKATQQWLFKKELCKEINRANKENEKKDELKRLRREMNSFKRRLKEDGYKIVKNLKNETSLSKSN